MAMIYTTIATTAWQNPLVVVAVPVIYMQLYLRDNYVDFYT